ncbi:hypothetical protein D7Z54_08520 [Salibacterium salarium]|uniref:Nuclease SbcCD subunit C n=1 Tax=Salibacterium salarium TaxID=284579 RepID=A0A428N5P2_9BACI|nr:AAA family ATPase [Salibacterium salarium]RSL33731.1 hypothetical protein D7Z54_08520 [Salibacterium salarium]
MRPIELSIKGLHSFREKQTINFSDLCKGGVFGIFGPTGSGKSSLLDAMTLALYGKVERAPNNTHGIINQAEDEMFVSFTFELGQQENASKYMIERTYKRSGEHHVKTAVSRLHHLTGNREILADKTVEVNKQVEDMLGLSIEDFTRAVVLPQGKFSEFLKLRGNDRRQMLQRIFHLEKYGDDLIKKVKTNLQNATHEKERIESEQQGLGEASKEAIETAEKQVKYWNHKLEEWITEKEEVDKRAEQAKQLKNWQEEWEDAQQNLQKLEEQQTQIEKYKTFLTNSDQAESLLPFGEAYLQSQQEKDTWLKKDKEARAALENLELKEEEITSRYNQFIKDKQAIDKKLSEQKQTIDKAEEIEQEMTTEVKEKSDLDAALEKITEKADYYKNEEEKIQQNLEKYNQAVKDFQEELAVLNKETENKYTIFQAKEDKQSITYLQNQLAQRKQEVNEAARKLSHVQEQKKNIEKELNTEHENTKNRFQQVMYWYNKSAEDKEWLETSMNVLQQWSNTYAEKQEQIKHQEMALHLASQLQADQPCPVCGALNHPAPQLDHDVGNTENISNEKQAMDNWIEHLKKFEFEVSQREWKLQHLSNLLTETMKETVLSTDRETTIEFTYKTISKSNDWENIIKDQLKQWKVEEQTIENLHRHIEKEKQQYQQKQEEYKDIAHQYETAYANYSEKSDQHAQLEKEVKEAMEQWKRSYPRFHFDTLEEEYKNLQAKDEKKEKLQTRIDQGYAHIQKLQSELEQWVHQRHNIMIEQTQVRAQTEQLHSRLNIKKQQLDAMLEGYSLSQLKKEVQAEESTWSASEEKIAHETDQIKRQKQEAKNTQSVASHSLQEASKRLEDSKEKWYKQLQNLENMEIDPSALRQDILTNEQKQQFGDEIQQHEKEQNKWQSTKDNLEYKMADRQISEEEWTQIEQRKSEIHDSVDEAREKRGAAVESLQEMQKKQERYQALEQKRKKWEKTYNQYQKLDNVFRGRGFVEFLAEEQLVQVSRTASERLHGLTKGRYAIEVDSQGGFIVRDDAMVV